MTRTSCAPSARVGHFRATPTWWSRRADSSPAVCTVHHEWIHADGKALAGIAGQKLTARVADTLPLHAAAEAHTRLAAGRLAGRLVLTP
ncbi:zinc-binding dehydrogenase [Nocardia sp. NPDC004568]|uniref:zinc-binding dehydrogenase n=1 Tax=Nocardia sp. NPDC004568 TaxID=3154551 RepID=UPI0033BDE4F5